MTTPNEALDKFHNALKKNDRIAFISAFVSGLLAHMVILTSDIPNHDGLASMYFDQNMITSGRWFLGMACAPTSYYSLPWLIGLFSILYISCAALVLRRILGMENSVLVALSSVLIAVFPSLAANFAYVFTMDGYMLGMLLCVCSVWAVSLNKKFGWLLGGVCLAFGMGCYQAYICIAILLCLYKAGELLMSEDTAKNKALNTIKYVGMGGFGVALYYILLKVLLAIQGKVLDTYQGINGMSSGNGLGLVNTIKTMYSDFVSFTFGSSVVITNVAVGAALVLLGIISVCSFISIAKNKGYLKKPLFYVFSVLFVIILPCAMNAILLISADVNYHVLMRYQWAFLIIVLVAIAERGMGDAKPGIICLWTVVVALVIINISYVNVDNISYSNLQKKYEKTYAYCLRLADRIEQTEGYYEGIPIAMVGVVGNESYPETDITSAVTDDLLGIGGDYLIYKSENYELFFKHYLGITFNMVSSDEVVNFYNEDFYADMPGFPAEGSVVLHEGVIYVKTENRR